MKMLRTSAVALGLVAGTFLSANAEAADTFHGTRSEKLVEKSHQIDIQIGHGYADLRVRRTVHNGGPRHDQATFYIDMPIGAVAVGLRTLGELNGKPHWFAGELLEAETAAARYRELTGIGGYYPKDPALLSWRTQSRLALQVFPCAPGQDKTVEYTLRIPTEYRDGRHHLLLSSMGTESLFAQANVMPMNPGETIFIGDKPVAGTGWAHLKEDIDLSVAPAGSSLLQGEVASLSVNPKKNIVHFHIDAAPRLGTVPSGAHVVVLVDASRSMAYSETQAQLAMARAFVGHFPNGRIAIVPFDRRIREPAAGFVSVGQAKSALKTMEIEQRNGSHVDVALAHADALLSKAPAGAARRILLLTDTRTRAEITPELLKSKMDKSGALLHIGVVKGDHYSKLTRNDLHDWKKVARPSGGLVWDAAIDMDEPKDADDAIIYEEWARPKRIDQVQMRFRGLEGVQFNEVKVLEEGQGIEELKLPAAGLEAIEFSGELWATPIKKEFVPTTAENQRWAGLFFGTSSYSEITEEEMMPLAMLGKVVSPVTSYLAIEPGVRPSTEGLEELSGVGMGFGSGFGLAGGRARVMAGVKFSDDKEAFLRREIDRALTQCGGQGKKAKASLESTLNEIVNVKVSIANEAADSKLTACFEEGVWNIHLRGDFRAEHDGFSIEI